MYLLKMKNHIKHATSFLLILIGLSFVLLSIWMSEDYTVQQKLDFCNKWIWPLLNTLGAGIFCSGIISIIIETKSWSDYFSEVLRKIVLGHDFLAQIDTNTLSDFHKNVLRIRYKNEDIGKDDSFLDFQQQLIEPLLTESYRENVNQRIIIRNINDSDDTINVEDTVSYQFRTNNNKISKNAHFDYSNEIIKKEDIKITLQKMNENEELINIDDNSKIRIEMNSDGTVKSIDVKLQNYISCDKLQIKNQSMYKIKKDQINVWQMSHLTKNLHMLIQAPENYKINFERFSLNEKFEDLPLYTNILDYSYNYWILPFSGFAWKLIKIS